MPPLCFPLVFFLKAQTGSAANQARSWLNQVDMLPLRQAPSSFPDVVEPLYTSRARFESSALIFQTSPTAPKVPHLLAHARRWHNQGQIWARLILLAICRASLSLCSSFVSFSVTTDLHGWLHPSFLKFVGWCYRIHQDARWRWIGPVWAHQLVSGALWHLGRSVALTGQVLDASGTELSQFHRSLRGMTMSSSSKSTQTRFWEREVTYIGGALSAELVGEGFELCLESVVLESALLACVYLCLQLLN